MTLADDVARARAVDEAVATLTTFVDMRGSDAESAALGTLRVELHRLTAEVSDLRSMLHDIANAQPSECDQTPYWAKKALGEEE